MTVKNNEKMWTQYMRYRAGIYETLIPEHYTGSLISEANWIIRSRMSSGEAMGIRVRPGDICYMDFGMAYLNEVGYQHFGLIISVKNRKALCVPMTSNPKTYAQAYDRTDNPNGKKHLMRIGMLEGMNRPSVLFLNDFRFVNTARVIDVKAHMPVDSAMFRTVRNRVIDMI